MDSRIARAAISVPLFFAGLVVPSGDTAAQNAKGLAGTYAAVSSVGEVAGKRIDTYGSNPLGLLILSPNGYYSLTLVRTDVPKFAGNSRISGSVEENKAAVAGSINHFGRYTVDGKARTLTFQIVGSTYPNWTGTSQTRPFAVTGDQLKYLVPNSSNGGSGEVTWKRVR